MMYLGEELIKGIKEAINHYSTSERVIGKWIDGKPIYRKICNGTITATGGFPKVSTGITNLSQVTQMYYVLRYQDRYFTGDRFRYYLDPLSSNQITIIEPDQTGNVTFVVEYTKTTD